MLPESSDPQGFPSWPLHTGGCKAPSKWDPKLQFTPNQSSYAVNDLVQLSCAGEYVPSVPQIRCISSGTQTLWNETATCEGKHSAVRHLSSRNRGPGCLSFPPVLTVLGHLLSQHLVSLPVPAAARAAECGHSFLAQPRATLSQRQVGEEHRGSCSKFCCGARIKERKGADLAPGKSVDRQTTQKLTDHARQADAVGALPGYLNSP